MDNLGGLADQLPRHGPGTHLAAAEAELQSAFRTSALAITTLLKAAQNTSKKAFQAGYSTALQDVLEYLQQGLDIHQGAPSDGIAQIIDYIEARQEAVKVDGADADGEEEQDAASFRPSAPTESRQQAVPQNLLPRQQQSTAQLSYASTSGSSIASTSQQQYRKRQSTRSLSPNTARHPVVPTTGAGAGAGPSSAIPAFNTRPSARSFPSYTNAHSLNPEDASPHSQPQVQTQQQQPGHYRTQESHPLSSSLPSSPDRTARHSHTRLPHENFTFSSTLPSHDASRPSTTVTGGPADSPVSSLSSSSSGTVNGNDLGDTVTPNPNSNAQSPITRLQARREKDRDGSRSRSRLSREGAHHRPHSLNDQHSQSASSSHSHPGNSISSGLKRRWTSSLLPDIDIDITPSSLAADSEHNINLDTESSGTEGEEEDARALPQQQAETVQKRSASDRAQSGGHGQSNTVTNTNGDMEMDMEGYRIDGNARPSKRMVRR